MRVLCRECERKLTSGSITETDIHVSRALTTLAFDEPELNEAVVERAFDLGRRIVIFSPNPEIIKKRLPTLERMLRKHNVQAIKAQAGNARSSKKILEELISPTKLRMTQAFKNGQAFEKIVIPHAALKKRGILGKNFEYLVKTFLEDVEVSLV